MPLDNYFPNQTQHSDITLEQKKDEIVEFLCFKGCAFPTEMTYQVSIGINDINAILFNLKRSGLIEKVFPNPDKLTSPFTGRIVEMWAKGNMGFSKFANCSWWTLTLAGFEYARVKFKGQGKIVRGSLLTYLGIPKPEEPIVSDALKFEDVIKEVGI